ncbi:MAG TPA: copper resistance protein NlpE N-terminal domain-containing protein [Chitinophagales bacterium]|nr:copper resistance protein NlpE N-terminal domain-containing protein [Chitinophagales bacterium]
MKINALKFTSIALIAATTLYSCNSSNDTTESTEFDDHHTAQNSLDWQGTYSGNLPCADCDAIETDLTLTDDMNYILISKYLGQAEILTDTLEGKFTWEGNHVKLDGIKDKERSSLYKVEENQVRQLDMKGEQITGDLASHYVMKKNGNLNVEDKKWQLVELNGKEIKSAPQTHYIIFHSKEGRLEAKADCNVILNNYKIKNELQVAIEPGITTLMACPDDLENDFIEVMKTVDNISTDGKTLSLNKARMAPLAKFILVDE